MKYYIFLFLSLLFLNISCENSSVDSLAAAPSFSIEAIKPHIQERGKSWGQAIQKKDISIIKNLYTNNAHYLPNDENSIHGIEDISNYWQASFDFLGGLELNMETLEGTKKLLYETGKGTVKVLNDKGEFDDLLFKYVNVWELQKDGNYKVVIDIYNNVKS